jgi:hypothetical protein
MKVPVQRRTPTRGPLDKDFNALDVDPLEWGPPLSGTLSGTTNEDPRAKADSDKRSSRQGLQCIGCGPP